MVGNKAWLHLVTGHRDLVEYVFTIICNCVCLPIISVLIFLFVRVLRHGRVPLDLHRGWFIAVIILVLHLCNCFEITELTLIQNCRSGELGWLFWWCLLFWLKCFTDPGEDEMLYWAARHFPDWIHAAYLSALPFLEAVFNAVVAACLGNAKGEGS